jgi:hypothetical protein
MRALTTLLFTTTILLSGVAATATASAAGLGPHRLGYQQMAEMEGHYLLTDGRHVHLTFAYGKLYMELDHHRQALEPDGEDRWVTRDRSIELKFKQNQAVDDHTDQIVLNYGNPAEAPPIRLATREARGRGAID